MISHILDEGNLTTNIGPNWSSEPRDREIPRSGQEVMDDFLSSCGAQGPLRLDVTGPGPRQSVRCVFEQPCVMIGRDSGNDLRLDHDQVSRRHAYLQVIGGRVFCMDLGSRTGLWWGKRTRNSGWLDSPMHIGPYRLQLPDRPASGPQQVIDWNPLETPAADQRILPRVSLEVFDGSRPTTHTLDRVLTFAGRSTACKLQVPNVSLSRYHCSLLLTAAGVWIVDLLSREGTVVNGQRVKWALLRPGDRIEMGKVQVVVHYDGTVPDVQAISAPAVNGDRFHSPAPTSDPEMPPLSSSSDMDPNSSARTLMAMDRAPQSLSTPSFDLKAIEAAGPQGALLMPVLQQFGMMQQQMMDQFQQSMQMVVQVFATMHRDQMGVLQKELDQVQRITRELHELQAEARAAKQRGPTYRNGSTMRPAPPRSPTPPEPVKRTTRSQPNEVTPGAPASSLEEERPATAAGPTGDMPELSDMHDWVNQRIQTLQKEREGRWQKILGFVLGK
jgi:pSer/pThr/pTyr-binding forkhead associated (FHA) protein